MSSDYRQAIVVLAPSQNDGAVACRVLTEAQVECEAVTSLDSLCQRIERPVGGLLIAEESLVGEGLSRLQAALSRQPSWSDLPIILMTSHETHHADDFFTTSGNISVLERPFSRFTLIRAVDVALRARRRQYQVLELMDQQIRATQKRDEFFASLSHELRTPLSVILGWIEILRNGELGPQATSHALEILERNARVQKGLIDDLLDMSRIITSKMHFEFSQVDLNQILKSAMRGFIPEAQAKGLSLNIAYPPQEIMIKGDEQRLSQVFANLITNSIKFTPEGGRITARLEQTADECHLTIEDSGHGIEPSFLPLIFDRLKQEDMSSTRTHGGLGLGLAITAHIVEAHQGRIEAFSAGRDQGTRMTLTLPLSKKPAMLADTNELHKASTLRGIKVLAVDDSPDILQLLELWLGKFEAEVYAVESADEALKSLDNFKPHVILSDIGMPGTSGYELIKAIRARSPEKGGQIPAIALTAYARDEERSRALQAGFQMHISKPISNRELVASVAALAKNYVPASGLQ